MNVEWGIVHKAIFLLKLSIGLITHLLEFIPALEPDCRLFPDPV
jgi:hypothetical protein